MGGVHVGSFFSKSTSSGKGATDKYDIGRKERTRVAEQAGTNSSKKRKTRQRRRSKRTDSKETRIDTDPSIHGR